MARGERRTAGEWTNPEIEAELGGKVVRGDTNSSGPLWSLGFAQSFEFAPRMALRKAIANHQITLAQIGIENFELELANRVRLLAYRTIVARTKSGAAQEISQRLRDLTSVLEQRAPTGVGPLLEMRIIQANALTLDRARIEAERELQTASYELNQLRGAPPGAPIALDAEELHFATLPPVSNLVASARLGNFDLRMRAVELEQQGFKVRLSRTERWPWISAGVFARGESAGDDENQFGVGVRLPLPLWNQNRGAIEAAKARQAQASASLQATLRKVENEIAGRRRLTRRAWKRSRNGRRKFLGKCAKRPNWRTNITGSVRSRSRPTPSCKRNISTRKSRCSTRKPTPSKHARKSSV